MGKVLRCPQCGSSDCKERVITLDRVAAAAGDFGVQAVKSIFTGKMDYGTAFENAGHRFSPNNTSEKSYRCKTCGYTWDNGQ